MTSAQTIDSTISFRDNEFPPAYSVDNNDLDRRIPLPCVLPQREEITKPFRGAFFSPFVRGWVPELEHHGINQNVFLTFIDGLNECFIAHPVFQAVGVAGGVMSMFYGVDPVQWTGAGLQLASGAASAATSYVRTRAYVKAVNKDIFKPAGLKVQILTTKKMLEKVGHSEDKLTLPVREPQNPTEQHVDREEAENMLNNTDESTIHRRIKALQGHVMPLETDVPAAVPPDNFFKKMSAAQARRAASKQQATQLKKQRKADEKYEKSLRKAEKTGEKSNVKIERLQAELSSLSSPCTKTQKKLEKKLNKRDEKVTKKLEKGTKKKDRLEKRENRRTNSIRWVVISNWTDDGAEESDEESNSEHDNDFGDESGTSSSSEDVKVL